LRNARHANAMASRLARALRPMPGVRLLHPTQGNAVFVDLPAHALPRLRQLGWHFYVFEGETGCRLMCSWDTQPTDVDAFADDLRDSLGLSRARKARLTPRRRRP
ncbi:MAG: threonine aldolase, partial [Limisphaerales bacterium]